MMQTKKQSKALFRLTQLVNYDCVVRLRSNPETLIAGILDSYDMDCVPSIIVIANDNGLRIVNMQDVSFIEEIKPR
jgi:hypothetical protein